MNRREISEGIRREARRIGFDLVGFARAEPLEAEGRALSDWLSAGRQAGMEWMKRRAEERVDPARVLEGVRSVICVGKNYHHPDLCEGPYHVSKYAQGVDYHRVLGPMLASLCAWMQTQRPESESRWYVDTGPVMEKAWARRAGLGWIGKNTLLLNRDFGSWMFLGVILTDIDLDTVGPVEDGCRSCTLCLDACPTGALPEPHVLDSSKCISYLTIEHRGHIDESLHPLMGSEVFGCDICQDVCPWNRSVSFTDESAFSEAPMEWSEERMNGLNADSFGEVMRTSAVPRAKWEGFQRNLEIARRNKQNPPPRHQDIHIREKEELRF